MCIANPFNFWELLNNRGATFLNVGIMGRKITKEDDDIIYDLYVNEMMSSTEIGKKIGVSHKSVLNHLEAMGVKRRSLEESHFSKNKKSNSSGIL